MQFYTLTTEQYESDRYTAILAMEESGTPTLVPYVDSVGLPTIGAGFNITERIVRNYVFETLDIGSEGLTYDTLSDAAQAAEDERPMGSDSEVSPQN